MRIRKIKKSDLKYCAKLLKKSYSKSPYNEKFVSKNHLKYIESKYKIAKENSFVLEMDRKVKGFIFVTLSYWANGPQAIMEEIVLDESLRGQGYSQKLNNYLENHLKSKGVKSIMLWVKKGSPAHKFHLKNKYKDANDLTVMFKQLKKR
ncbi:MAG: GNAT family N-acetyltransferase [Candidatus Diapherotrites archaeon]